MPKKQTSSCEGKLCKIELENNEEGANMIYVKESRLTLGFRLALTKLLLSSERVGFTSPKSHLSIFIYVEQR